MSDARVVVLASGSGSLFQALIDSQADLGIEIVALVVDKDVPAVQRAQSAGISVIEVPMLRDREQWDQVMESVLTDLRADLVISAGFMRVLGANVVAEFSGRLINTHPALLPEYPGAHAVRDALAARATKTGTTVHFVDTGVDTGPIIAQREVEILPSDTEESLHERIKVVERELLVETVGNIVMQKISLIDGKVVTQ
ncbi:MAG: phosphoribosylglycinamide formyltransferase [Actinobacteria bacterium]|nr:phosphoribosylglycinamide formyltransferase [Actinomycetota bacterium]